MPITGYTLYTHCLNTTALEGGYYHPDLIDKQTEAPRYQVTCLGSHSWLVTKLDLNQVPLGEGGEERENDRKEGQSEVCWLSFPEGPHHHSQVLLLCSSQIFTTSPLLSSSVTSHPGQAAGLTSSQPQARCQTFQWPESRLVTVPFSK